MKNIATLTSLLLSACLALSPACASEPAPEEGGTNNSAATGSRSNQQHGAKAQRGSPVAQSIDCSEVDESDVDACCRSFNSGYYPKQAARLDLCYGVSNDDDFASCQRQSRCGLRAETNRGKCGTEFSCQIRKDADKAKPEDRVSRDARSIPNDSWLANSLKKNEIVVSTPSDNARAKKGLATEVSIRNEWRDALRKGKPCQFTVGECGKVFGALEFESGFTYLICQSGTNAELQKAADAEVKSRNACSPAPEPAR